MVLLPRNFLKDPNDLLDRATVTDGKPLVIVTEAVAREILSEKFKVKKESIRIIK